MHATRGQTPSPARPFRWRDRRARDRPFNLPGRFGGATGEPRTDPFAKRSAGHERKGDRGQRAGSATPSGACSADHDGARGAAPARRRSDTPIIVANAIGTDHTAGWAAARPSPRRRAPATRPAAITPARLTSAPAIMPAPAPRRGQPRATRSRARAAGRTSRPRPRRPAHGAARPTSAARPARAARGHHDRADGGQRGSAAHAAQRRGRQPAAEVVARRPRRPRRSAPRRSTGTPRTRRPATQRAPAGRRAAPATRAGSAQHDRVGVAGDAAAPARSSGRAAPYTAGNR